MEKRGSKKSKQDKKEKASQKIGEQIFKDKIALTPSFVNKFLSANVPFIIDMSEVDVSQFCRKNRLLADAIKQSKSLKIFKFREYQGMSRIQTEWDALTDALSTNQSITELWCSYDGTEPYRAEKMFVDVLAQNKRIKKFIYSCHRPNSMRYLQQILSVGDSIEDLDLSANKQLSDEDRELLCEIFSYNTTIMRLEVDLSPTLADFLGIAKALVHNKSVQRFITTARIGTRISNPEISVIKEMLQMNKTLTTINLEDVLSTVRYLPMIAEGLKTNKSLTTLELKTQMQPEWYSLLGDVLLVNDTLTKLNLKNTRIHIDRLPDLARGLANNTSLKSLNISQSIVTSDIAGLDALETALLKNKTLTKLDIRHAPPKSYEELLKHNKTLRTFKLHLGEDNQWLCRALAENDSLTKLVLSNRKSYGVDFTEQMSQSLSCNDTLLHLEAFVEFSQYTMIAVDLPEWKKKVEQNRALLQKRKSEIRCFLMMILYQRGFTEKLPLEHGLGSLAKLKCLE
jgi:hypothetical protein